MPNDKDAALCPQVRGLFRRRRRQIPIRNQRRRGRTQRRRGHVDHHAHGIAATAHVGAAQAVKLALNFAVVEAQAHEGDEAREVRFNSATISASGLPTRRPASAGHRLCTSPGFGADGQWLSEDRGRHGSKFLSKMGTAFFQFIGGSHHAFAVAVLDPDFAVRLLAQNETTNDNLGTLKVPLFQALWRSGGTRPDSVVTPP